jgi:hypothetical protein
MFSLGKDTELPRYLPHRIAALSEIGFCGFKSSYSTQAHKPAFIARISRKYHI